jgi:hypothetical protein
METTANGNVILNPIAMRKVYIVRNICMELNALVPTAFMGRIVRKFVIVTDILAMLKQENVAAKMDFLVKNVKKITV